MEGGGRETDGERKVEREGGRGTDRDRDRQRGRDREREIDGQRDRERKTQRQDGGPAPPRRRWDVWLPLPEGGNSSNHSEKGRSGHSAQEATPSAVSASGEGVTVSRWPGSQNNNEDRPSLLTSPGDRFAEIP